MLQNRDFILLLDSKLHLSNLERLLELSALSKHVLSALLLLAPSLIALVQVPAQILNLLFLLPENLTKFVSRVSHVLQHVTQFLHRLTSLVKDVSSSVVV